MFYDANEFNNGQAADGTTQKMNWTISFVGTPTWFSDRTKLTSANRPTFR